jgi:hypothetical protein
MGILIGMDEAGYGPNFGPLVVAATAWHVADEGSGFGVQASENGAAASAAQKERRKTSLSPRASTASVATSTPHSALRTPHSEIDLYRRLRTIVAKRPSDRRIAIADSKVLYSPGVGLRQLERGLHAVLRSMRQTLTSWSAIVNYCGADPDGHHKQVCWPDGFNCLLPMDAAVEELARLEARFTRACDGAGVRPLFIRARLVYPQQFNELVAYYGTKGAALSHVTVSLLREVVDAVPAFAPRSSQLAPIYAVCDKHGGRNYYTALLQHHFSEHWVNPVFESHAESRYEWGRPDSRIQVTFRMQGERFLPTALASMAAKYLRELAMRAFNEFWCARIEGLRPTAGYPKDSHRFRNDIRATQRKLGIDDHVLWRNR